MSAAAAAATSALLPRSKWEPQIQIRVGLESGFGSRTKVNGAIHRQTKIFRVMVRVMVTVMVMVRVGIAAGFRVSLYINRMHGPP